VVDARPLSEVSPPALATILVVARTPFTSLVRILVVVEYVSVLFPITEDVADTPLIVVVRTFPVRDCVNELMMFAAADAIPFTVEVKVLSTDVKRFELIAVVVESTPFTFEVRMFADDERVLVVELVTPSVDVATHVGTPPTTERIVPFVPGAVGVATLLALPTKILPSASGILGSTEKIVVPRVVVPFTVRLFERERFVPVALPKKSDVKFASVEKRLVVVAFVARRLVSVVDPIFAAVRNGVTTFVTLVSRPCASTVSTGIVVDEPYVPGVTPVLISENTGFCASPDRAICPAVPVAVVSLLLKAVQSIAVRSPRFSTEAEGRLKV